MMQRRDADIFPQLETWTNHRPVGVARRLGWTLLLSTLSILAAVVARGAESGDMVAVVYNSRFPESKSVAEHYARKRGVPAGNLFGLDAPVSEAISRKDFREKLQGPILDELEKRGLLTFDRKEGTEGGGVKRGPPVTAKIRYLILCHGIPLKIQNDPSLTEEGAGEVPSALRRNDAAVDSELSLLPLSLAPPPLTGPLRNVLFGVTNSFLLNPANGLLMVARLDGPTAAVARGLVDKALIAERDGLWGRAYFDARGLTNGAYKVGDDWIHAAADTAKRAGFQTVLDDKPETFTPGFPMSHIALYAGWYDANVSGPFTRPKVEFMPGAFAYHLHSYSAATIRSTASHWAGPLLDRGATATMGCVEEPYLEATPDLGVFFSRLISFGFSFGEAAYASQTALSWQTTVIGDPLYRPFEKHPATRHAELTARGSSLMEWSILRAVNQNIVDGESPEHYVEFLQQIDATRQSAVLLEKLGDLQSALCQPEAALESYRRALAHKPSPNQQMRLLLALGIIGEESGHSAVALDTYQTFAMTFPDHPDLAFIHKKMAALADRLGNPTGKERTRIEENRSATR
jgi:uncharacterized protein (TIGR03790 family)